MGASASAIVVPRGERLYVELADNSQAVREAQALRYRVFGLELGAKLKSQASELDIDDFDERCEHMLVRETRTGRVVGCTRLLDEPNAAALGRFYSESEFDLGRIAQLEGRLIELGRTCIAPDYRHGSAIAVLWSGVASYMQRHQVDFLFGCASIPLGDRDAQAAAIMNRLRRQAMAPEYLQVTPRVPLQVGAAAASNLDAPLPPLLKAYVRIGAKACGEPCRDADFQVADVLMLLDVRDLNPAYARHFINRAVQSGGSLAAP